MSGDQDVGAGGGDGGPMTCNLSENDSSELATDLDLGSSFTCPKGEFPFLLVNCKLFWREMQFSNIFLTGFPKVEFEEGVIASYVLGFGRRRLLHYISVNNVGVLKAHKRGWRTDENSESEPSHFLDIRLTPDVHGNPGEFMYGQKLRPVSKWKCRQFAKQRMVGWLVTSWLALVHGRDIICNLERGGRLKLVLNTNGEENESVVRSWEIPDICAHKRNKNMRYYSSKHKRANSCVNQTRNEWRPLWPEMKIDRQSSLLVYELRIFPVSKSAPDLAMMLLNILVSSFSFVCGANRHR